MYLCKTKYHRDIIREITSRATTKRVAHGSIKRPVFVPPRDCIYTHAYTQQNQSTLFLLYVELKQKHASLLGRSRHKDYLPFLLVTSCGAAPCRELPWCGLRHHHNVQ